MLGKTAIGHVILSLIFFTFFSYIIAINNILFNSSIWRFIQSFLGRKKQTVPTILLAIMSIQSYKARYFINTFILPFQIYLADTYTRNNSSRSRPCPSSSDTLPQASRCPNPSALNRLYSLVANPLRIA